MKNSFKLKIVFTFVLLFSLISCDDYLNVNDNPNDLLLKDVTPELIMPGAMNNAHRVQARRMNSLGNIWMQNWGGDVNNFTQGNAEEYSLQLNNNSYSDLWDGLYPAIANFEQIIKYNSENRDNHKAVAYIMKSYYMQLIVDLYGDVPYSQAFNLQDNVKPVYDNDKDIYLDLVKNIDLAIDKFYSADANDLALGTSDVMLGGNINNWLKFANAVKMKLLLRQSTLAETNPTLNTYITNEFNKIIANGAGFPTVNVTNNPGYSSATNNNQNPFYNQFILSNNNNTNFNAFTRATDYIARWLNGTATLTSPSPALVDPRRGRIYATSSNVVGAIQGNVTGPTGMSQIGPGLLVGHNQPGYVMTLAEIRFMMSEAKVRNYLPGGLGSALTDFNAGITASFTLLGAGTATAYIAAANAKPGVGWASTPNKIQAIMTQKWLATNGINAMESYIEQVRTGFPVIPLATTALYPNRPYRLLYPVSELISNATNVPLVPLSQIFTQGPFWKN